MSDRVNNEITEKFAGDNKKFQVKYMFLFSGTLKRVSFLSRLSMLEIYFCQLADGCRSLTMYVLLTNVVYIGKISVAKR